MSITFNAILVRSPLENKHNNTLDWKEKAYQWKIEINNQTFDYYTGSGLVEKVRHSADVRPKKPTLDDVLHCLVSDASACDMSFEEWASDYGYDSDSRKALEIYLACQENTKKLRKAGININAERERLQDY